MLLQIKKLSNIANLYPNRVKLSSLCNGGSKIQLGVGKVPVEFCYH